jgi:hypothetical protein
MTAARRARVREVLRPVRRGSADVGATVLSGSRWSGRTRASATGMLIAQKALLALDEDLGTMLVRELERYTALRDAARQSRLQPDQPVYVELVQLHAIPVVTTADLDVLVDRVHRATVTVVLEVEFGLFGMRAVLHDGWLTHLDGQQSLSAALTVESITFGGGRCVLLDQTLAESSRTTEWAAYSLPRPVPLLGPDGQHAPGWS